jgi:chromosome segregation ATPase
VEVTVIIAVVGTGAAVVFGYAAFTRNAKQDNSALVQQLAQIQAGLEFLKQQLAELSLRQTRVTEAVEELKREMALSKADRENLRRDVDWAHDKFRKLDESVR